MNEIDSIVNKNKFFELLQVDNESKKAEENDQNERNRADFMTLMIAQLENQNPLDPQDGAEFLSQLAQFNTVEGLQTLNTNVSDLETHLRSSQALQATALVGRQVRVESQIGVLYEQGGVTGMIDLPQSTNNMQVAINDMNGQLVRQMDLQTQAAGEVPFGWDGTDESGNRMPPGVYVVKATADQEGEATNLNTYLDSNVDSVTIGNTSEIILNVAAVGPKDLSEVKRIQ